jgi:hypothetical protein
MRSRIRTVLHVLIATGAAATVIGTLVFPPRAGDMGEQDWPRAAAYVVAWLVFWTWAWWMVTLVFRPRQQGDEKG